MAGDIRELLRRAAPTAQTAPDLEEVARRAGVRRATRAGGLTLVVLALIALAVPVIGGLGEKRGGEPIIGGGTVTATPTDERPNEGVGSAALATARWVTIDLEGIRTDAGTLVWRTSPVVGEMYVARDDAGGIAFADAQGLWWLAAGSDEPTFVGDSGGILLEIVGTSDEPVAHLWIAQSEYVDLATGRRVDPLPGRLPGDAAADVWTAANGMTARIEGPTLAVSSEGAAANAEEPAHLLVEQGGSLLMDARVGTSDSPYVRIHDFNGRYLIVSQWPLEPAQPMVRFLVIDLSCGTCTETFPMSSGDASLLGPDVDWTGPIDPVDVESLEGR